jgi:hypothetical protein
MEARLRNFDLFGYEIKLNYQKEDNYRTVYGGVMSLLLMFLFMAFFVLVYVGTGQLQEQKFRTETAVYDPGFG